MKSLGMSVLIALLVSACGFHKDKSPQSLTSIPDNIVPGYGSIRELVFQPNCFACHTEAEGNQGGVNLETYASAYEERDAILNEVVTEGVMPPDEQVMDPAARTLVNRWFVGGAPENDTPVAN